MPELPEVQNMVNYIQKCNGQTIISTFRSIYKLRFTNDRNFIEDTTNAIIKNIYRKAKYIIINLDNNISIIIHAGMSGIISIKDKTYIPIKHDHVILNLSKSTLVYNDPRRFGLFVSIPTDQINILPFFNNIGYDALSDALTAEYFYNKIHKSSVPIKQILLNQKIISGCGNIYANEALYKSEINPLKQSKDLSLQEIEILIDNLKNILLFSIEKGGSTLKDYRKPDGNKGNFQSFFQIYGKENQSCPKCKKKNVECNIIKTNISNRATFYCKNTQK